MCGSSTSRARCSPMPPAGTSGQARAWPGWTDRSRPSAARRYWRYRGRRTPGGCRRRWTSPTWSGDCRCHREPRPPPAIGSLCRSVAARRHLPWRSTRPELCTWPRPFTPRGSRARSSDTRSNSVRHRTRRRAGPWLDSSVRKRHWAGSMTCKTCRPRSLEPPVSPDVRPPCFASSTPGWTISSGTAGRRTPTSSAKRPRSGGW